MSRHKHLPCSYRFLRDEVDRFVHFWFQTFGNAPLPATKQDLGATYADSFRGQLPLWALIRGLRLQKLIEPAAAGDPNLVRWLVAEPAAPQQHQQHSRQHQSPASSAAASAASASSAHLECVPCRVRCTSADALLAHLQGRHHAARIAIERVRLQQTALQARGNGGHDSASTHTPDRQSSSSRICVFVGIIFCWTCFSCFSFECISSVHCALVGRARAARVWVLTLSGRQGRCTHHVRHRGRGGRRRAWQTPAAAVLRCPVSRPEMGPTRYAVKL